MSVQVRCDCGKLLRVPEQKNRRFRCPNCQKLVVLQSSQSKSDVDHKVTPEPARSSDPPSPPSMEWRAAEWIAPPIETKQALRLPRRKRQSGIPLIKCAVAVSSGAMLAGLIGLSVWGCYYMASHWGSRVPKELAFDVSVPPQSEVAIDDDLMRAGDAFFREIRNGQLTKPALEMFDEAGFRKRLRSKQGSRTAQSKGISPEDVIKKFLNLHPLDGMMWNGAFRHWRMVERTTWDGYPAVIIRYFRDCHPPKHYIDKSMLQDLIPLMSFEDFYESAGTLYQPTYCDAAHFDNGLPSRFPNANGWLLPRVGMVTVVFDHVDGGYRVIDLVNTMSQLSLSRAGGELFMRDWTVIGMSTSKEVVAEAMKPTYFGEIPPGLESFVGDDMGLNSHCWLYRGAAPPDLEHVEPKPLSEETDKIRAVRLAHLVDHLSAQSKQLSAELERFRHDYRGDLGGEMAIVFFTLMRESPTITQETAPAVLDSARRLYQRFRDPIFVYAQWIVARAMNRVEDEKSLRSRLIEAGLVTTEIGLANIREAVANSNKDEVAVALKKFAAFWNPNGVAPEDSLSIRSKWTDQESLLSGIERKSIGQRMKDRLGMPSSIRDRISNAPTAVPPDGLLQPEGNFPGELQMPRSEPSIMRPPTRPQHPQSSNPMRTVIVEIQSHTSFDAQKAFQALKQELKFTNGSYSMSNNNGSIRIEYLGDLQSVRDAIHFGTVESVDSANSIIRVRVH